MIHLAPHIAKAVRTGQPVVALETTVFTHGLPHPLNAETALGMREAIRRFEAVPAFIGVVAGLPKIGLSDVDLQIFIHGTGVRKTNLANLGSVVADQACGATTVSASVRLAHMAGIRVFATGGIGGVHRDDGQSLDVSSDLTALAGVPLIVVCSGTKGILDIPRTFELIETLGVAIIGYQTDQFPAFYSCSSGIRLETVARTPDQVVDVARAHWATGSTSSVLVTVPVPSEAEIDSEELEGAISRCLLRSKEARISGKEVTPFLLSQLERATGGRSLRANVALLLNNASVAAEISRAWVQMAP